MRAHLLADEQQGPDDFRRVPVVRVRSDGQPTQHNLAVRIGAAKQRGALLRPLTRSLPGQPFLLLLLRNEQLACSLAAASRILASFSFAFQHPPRHACI